MIAKRITPVIQYLLLLLMALAVLYPLLFSVLSSFMTEKEVSNFPPPLFPSQLYLGNFKQAIESFPIIRFILNSFIVSSAIMVSQVITSSLAAYAFSFMKFKGKNALFAIFLATMMIPWEVTIIPNYLTIKSWGWMDSYQGLIVPFMAGAFGVFLLRQFFCSCQTSCSMHQKSTGADTLETFSRLFFRFRDRLFQPLGFMFF